MPTVTQFTNLGFIQQPDGGNNNTWGSVLDSVIAVIDQAIAGVATVSVAGGSNVTLTFANGDLPPADQARNKVIILSGLLTANINLIVPQITKTWCFLNETTGAFTVTVTTGLPSTTTVSLPNLATLPNAPIAGVPTPPGWGMVLACDGTNVFEVLSFMNNLQVSNLSAANATIANGVIDAGSF